MKNKKETFEYKRVEIFNVVKKDDKVHICIGNNVIYREEFKTMEDAVKIIEQKPWELIVNVLGFISNELKNTKQNEQGNN